MSRSPVLVTMDFGSARSTRSAVPTHISVSRVVEAGREEEVLLILCSVRARRHRVSTRGRVVARVGNGACVKRGCNWRVEGCSATDLICVTQIKLRVLKRQRRMLCLVLPVVLIVTRMSMCAAGDERFERECNV